MVRVPSNRVAINCPVIQPLNILMKKQFVVLQVTLFTFFCICGQRSFAEAPCPPNIFGAEQSSCGKVQEAIPITSGYFLDCSNGNSNGDGTSHDQRWDSLSDVKTFSFETGDDVYLLSGSVCEDQTLDVDWGGDATNYAVIGCYKMNGNQPVLCEASDQLPEINGTYEASCRVTAETNPCDVGTSDAVPRGGYDDELVTINSNLSFWRLENISIKDSAGVGLRVGKSNHHFVIDGIEVSFSATMAMDLAQFSHQWHIKNSKFSHSSLCSYHWRGGSSTPSNVDDLCRKRPGPAQVELGGLGNTERTFGIFENNDVAMDFTGELLGSYFNRGSLWIIGNRLREGPRNGIYMASTARNIIEHNVIWGFDSQSYGEATVGKKGYGESYKDKDQRGLDTAIEIFEPHGLADGFSDNIFRNNVLGGTSECLFFAGVFRTRTENIGRVGAQYYHNTCVGFSSSGFDGDNQRMGTEWNDHLEVVNNVFYSNLTSGQCGSYPASSYLDFEMGPNYWEAVPNDVDCRESTHNPSSYVDVIGYPQLARDRDAWGESDWGLDNGPTIGDARLQAGDPGIRAGRPLQEPIPWLNMSAFYYADQVSTCQFEEGEWEKQAAYDGLCNLRNPTGPTLGAVE